ncbi:MAG TPA: winged helix-turn-helix domain-containing protein [Stellaceae bacterium]|nr:winged helix-turn-helix domain-containing protein [Stellaceae bacterium]
MPLQPTVPREQREPMRRDRLALIKRQPSPAAADATLEFGRFRLSLRRRQLLADSVPVELGTRAFDLLMVLIEADGALVTKKELVALVWPGIFVEETNLKVQISALRKALGKDRDLIRTEFGRGYRFIAVIRSTTAVAECESASDTPEALVVSKAVPQTDLSAIASQLVCLGAKLDEVLSLLATHRMRMPAGSAAWVVRRSFGSHDSSSPACRIRVGEK